ILGRPLRQGIAFRRLGSIRTTRAAPRLTFAGRLSSRETGPRSAESVSSWVSGSLAGTGYSRRLRWIRRCANESAQWPAWRPAWILADGDDDRSGHFSADQRSGFFTAWGRAKALRDGIRSSQRLSGGAAWTRNYPSTPCQVGITCGITPTGTDIIIETYVSAQGCPNNGVSWIRYQLVGTTLNRGITCKSSTDPDAATSAAGIMAPYVQNVMNNASAAQIAQFQTYYPSMFPSGAPVPIFTYICDTQSGLAQDCSTASATDNSPRNVRAV